MLAFFTWDPKPDLFVLPLIHLPILWYGVLFAVGFALGFPIFVHVLTRFLGKAHKRQAVEITDKLTMYIVVATIIGARLGHFLFYENPTSYLRDPLQLFRVWEGGLASHGAAIAIAIALCIFALRNKKKYPELHWLNLLDFVVIPAALAGFFIRIGNFVNQEILGRETAVPWAVVFGHPADFSPIVPRHPVQLYEAIFYLGVFFLLWWMSFKKTFIMGKGKLFGLFLILVFGFRFIVEFWKMEQSKIISTHLTMGQILSLPLIVGGFLFYFWKKK